MKMTQTKTWRIGTRQHHSLDFLKLSRNEQPNNNCYEAIQSHFNLKMFPNTPALTRI